MNTDFVLLTRDDVDCEYSPRLDSVRALTRTLGIEDNPEWQSAYAHRSAPCAHRVQFFRTATPADDELVAFMWHPHDATMDPRPGDETRLDDARRVVTSVSNGRVYYWRYGVGAPVHVFITLRGWAELHREEVVA